MSKTIMVVGGGLAAHKQAALVEKLGYRAVRAVSESEGEVPHSDDSPVGTFRNTADLLELARDWSVDGVHPATPEVMIPVSEVAAALGLAGYGENCGRVLCFSTLRESLAAKGYSTPNFGLIRNVEEVSTVGSTLTFPQYVLSLEGRPGHLEHGVSHVDDLALAVKKASNPGGLPVVFDEPVGDPTWCVCGIVREGGFTLCGVFDKVVRDDHFRYACSYFRIDRPDGEGLERWCEGVMSSLKMADGVACLEVSGSPPDGRIIDVTFGPDIDVPHALTKACGVELWEDAIRLAAGDYAPRPGLSVKFAAIHWVLSGSGVVTHVPNVEEALKDERVVSAEIVAKVGDVIKHVSHIGARDAIGYVVARGDSARESYEAAREVSLGLRLETKPFYE